MTVSITCHHIQSSLNQICFIFYISIFNFSLYSFFFAITILLFFPVARVIIIDFNIVLREMSSLTKILGAGYICLSRARMPEKRADSAFRARMHNFGASSIISIINAWRSSVQGINENAYNIHCVRKMSQQLTNSSESVIYYQ